MTNFTWNVTNLFTETIDGKPYYVVIAYYIVTGVDGEYSATLSNNSQFSTEDVGIFIPYNELTENIVIGWIKETLGPSGILSIENCIQGQINSQINPPVVPENTPLPWS